MARKAAEKVKVTKTPFVFDPIERAKPQDYSYGLGRFQGIRTESEEMGRCEE